MLAAAKPSISLRLGVAGSEPLSREAAARLRSEQLSTILHQTPNMMAANACNALVLLAAFWSTPKQTQALLWALAVIAIASVIYFRYTRRIPRDRTSARRLSAMTKLFLHTLALSLCWAALPILFFQDAPPGVQLLIACLTAGMLSGGAFALASVPFAAFTFTIPIFFGAATALIWSNGPDYLLISLVLIIYTLVLLRGVVTYAEQIKSRVLQQIETERKVRTDEMTSLPNRLWFHESVDTEFSRLSSDNEYFALIYVDLDDFKLVNDRLGHAGGDELLVEVAKRMKAAVRPSDLVARLGGDEFAVVATSITDADHAIAIAKRLTQCFETPFSIGSEGVYCGASLGVALAPRDGDNPHSLLRNADTALYRAKQNGGLFCVFEPRHESVAREERALERDLRRALLNNQFTLVFQPLLQFGANEIKGCEALVRWVHPTRGQVPPSIFIPIAERTGFIHDLGLWILEEACRAAAQFPEGIRVAVNVSAVQLRDPKFAERALSALSKAGLSRIGVEITETALLSDDQATDSSLRKLASAGVEISLDDFGTGYSSLSYLRKLPLHKIKIDRSFVTDLLKQSDCEAITRGVIKMAADLGISCVGEGVEHIEQLEWLRRNGCYEAQGYLISRPLSPPDFANFLASWNPQRFVA
jgi:diguanylate cyclase